MADFGVCKIFWGRNSNIRIGKSGKIRCRHEKNANFLKKFLRFFSDFFHAILADFQMGHIGQNWRNQKKYRAIGKSGKKFCRHQNFANFLTKILGMRTNFFRRKTGNTRRYLKKPECMQKVDVIPRTAVRRSQGKQTPH